MAQDGLGDHFGGLAPGAGPRHGDVGGDVAVFGVGGHLDDEGGQIGGRQVAGLHGGLRGLAQQGAGLGQGGLAGIVVFKSGVVAHRAMIPFSWTNQNGRPGGNGAGLFS